MASLVALSPAADLLPVSAGGVTLGEVPAGPVTWIAPFRGREAAVSDALEAATGAAFPAPNRWTGGRDGVRIVWVGPGQALVLGAAPDPAPGEAAVADQSDGFARLALEGGAAREVLARLSPVDLREGVFEVGHAARTLLFHMTATLMRTGPEAWEILVFRSMARTAVHDIGEAMRGVAGRAAV